MTELNTRVGTQARQQTRFTNKLCSLTATSMICAIVSITVTIAISALWLEGRMKHTSRRGPCLSTEKSLQIPQLPPPLKWCSDVYPSFHLGWSNSFFLQCFSSSVFLFLLFGIGNGGAFFCCCFSTIVYSLSLNRTAPVQGRANAQYVLQGRGAVSSICTRMINTSQTLPLALIGCIDSGVVDSCKSKYSHWVELQTMDFYTADLFYSIVRS